MKTIGIKLADGSFYPVLEEGSANTKKLELTTANNNQTKVMVDLYRSATCSMDDAEYVDSLQIENLVEHPNGETDIAFTVSLDENNQLDAQIVDTETGNSSVAEKIQLISRTIEERLNTDEFGITDSEEPVFTETEVSDEDVITEEEGLASFNPEEDNFDTQEILADQGEAIFDDIETDDTNAEDVTADDLATATVEDSVEDTAEVSTDDTVTEIPDVEDNIIEEDPTDIFAEDNSGITSEMVGFDDSDTIFGDMTEANEFEDVFADENTVEESSDDTIVTDDVFADTSDDTAENETLINEDVFADDMFADDSTSENTINEESSEDIFNDMNLDDMDFEDDTAPAAGGISFTGLYDKETEMGDSSFDEEEDTKKKTKAPVIICLICAVICILAVILILFVIPSPCNILKRTANKAETEVVEKETPAPVVEEPAVKEDPVPAAKEDEVIVIEKAEEVVPVQPEPAVKKPENIEYKIKWGDTLWDIAGTYYKNPWKYKYIARYNGIKNPDHIISGTKIIIPAE